MNIKSINSVSQTKVAVGLPLIALCLLALSACTTTQKVDIKQSGVNCAFLADDCSLLTVGGKDQTGLRYVNPAAQWRHYTKIIIDPVTFWSGSSTQISSSDQQMLVNYLSQQLKEQLGQKFEIVDQPGPGVMKFDAALTDAEAATPGLRSISMIVPQAHMLSNLKYLATGTMPFVGAAQVEAKVTDSVTGQILAMVVDKRIGGGSFTTGFQWQWGDAENAINHWAELAATRLSSWTSGTAAP
ncbi:DUF3313 domain-containing protein [Methylobacter sp. S3L5C]|uniref:DUF3313 domain-containing protein n=1 Tax=Methylobacter sp. S3L5C TaxID=2839024 RepID=UPI001FAD74D4|nr:DUF3313 domain-containing protein [Methylobacter sp. S3L5C]UOA09382.1 DUF3313 domain-containing protein [Methylobacter sp. S3L5C]